MDVLHTMIAPLVAKYAKNHQVELYTTPHGTKLHATSGCQNAKRITRVSMADPTKTCARCMRRSSLGAIRADEFADAFALHAVRYVATSLVSRGPSWSSQRDEIDVYVDLIDTLAGGSHPVASGLRDLFPGGVADADIDLSRIGAAKLASWPNDPATQEWARILTGNPAKDRTALDKMQAWVGVGSEPSRAITLAVTGLCSPEALTPDMLPNTLTSPREAYDSTQEWLQTEWETAADTARAGLTAALTVAVTESHTSTALNAPLVVVGSRRCLSRASMIAARHHHPLVTGDATSEYGLVLCSQLIFEALKLLDRGSDLNIVYEPGPVVDTIVRAPEVLKFAETLRRDHPDRSWAELIDMAVVIAQPV